ncbi:MAG: hypothetical protein JWO62_734 [Acidimicrobiaceae bacterium]|nr:hypothetical protein [Acidimicrobiaceae bacterium]
MASVAETLPPVVRSHLLRLQSNRLRSRGHKDTPRYTLATWSG